MYAKVPKRIRLVILLIPFQCSPCARNMHHICLALNILLYIKPKRKINILTSGFVLKRIKYFVYPMLISLAFEWIVNDGWIHGVSIIKDLANSAVVLIGYGPFETAV
jgi:hypothetical protein